MKVMVVVPVRDRGMLDGLLRTCHNQCLTSNNKHTYCLIKFNITRTIKKNGPILSN